jgi:hypothetical protein
MLRSTLSSVFTELEWKPNCPTVGDSRDRLAGGSATGTIVTVVLQGNDAPATASAALSSSCNAT